MLSNNIHCLIIFIIRSEGGFQPLETPLPPVSATAYLYFAHDDCPDLWFAHEQSEDCVVNLWFVVQTMDPRFAQDNPWIAQIHASRISMCINNTSVLILRILHNWHVC